MTKNLSYLTHPYVLFALGLTALNDHYFKFAYPGFLTGKLSDFAGLFFFPLFLHALYDFFRSPLGLHTVINKKRLLFFIFLTDVLFILFKYSILREYLIFIFNIQIIRDYSDLIALSVNWVTYSFSKKYLIKEASA